MYDRKFCQRITDESWIPNPNMGRDLSWELEYLIGSQTSDVLNRVGGPQVIDLAYRIVSRGQGPK